MKLLTSLEYKNLRKHHIYYIEIYIKNGGNSSIVYEYTIPLYAINPFNVIHLLHSEIYFFKAVELLTEDEVNSLLKMICSSDNDNAKLAVILLKKKRIKFNKLMKDPLFESKVIVDICFDYYNKIHKLVMDKKLITLKKEI